MKTLIYFAFTFVFSATAYAGACEPDILYSDFSSGSPELASEYLNSSGLDTFSNKAMADMFEKATASKESLVVEEIVKSENFWTGLRTVIFGYIPNIRYSRYEAKLNYKGEDALAICNTESDFGYFNGCARSSVRCSVYSKTLDYRDIFYLESSLWIGANTDKK